jgi:hypothetical protein
MTIERTTISLHDTDKDRFLAIGVEVGYKQKKTLNQLETLRYLMDLYDKTEGNKN